MKMIIILTMLLIGSAHADGVPQTSREYAEHVKARVASNFKFSRLECKQQFGELYSCELIKTGGTTDEYAHEYVYLVGKVRELNANIAPGSNIRPLTILTKDYWNERGQNKVSLGK